MGLFLKKDSAGTVRVDGSTVVWAAILLIALGVLGYLAERGTDPPVPTTTANLWAAFQTILGVIVGFLGGEALGRSQV